MYAPFDFGKYPIIYIYMDPNLEVLIVLQQPTPSKFKVSSVVGFEPRTMWHLPGPHFPTLTKILRVLKMIHSRNQQ